MNAEKHAERWAELHLDGENAEEPKAAAFRRYREDAAGLDLKPLGRTRWGRAVEAERTRREERAAAVPFSAIPPLGSIRFVTVALERSERQLDEELDAQAEIPDAPADRPGDRVQAGEDVLKAWIRERVRPGGITSYDDLRKDLASWFSARGLDLPRRRAFTSALDRVGRRIGKRNARTCHRPRGWLVTLE